MLLLIVILGVTLPIFVLRLVVLPEKLENIKVLLLQMDLLLVQAIRHDLRLLTDRFRPPIDFLEDDLHHGGLELGQHVHLMQGLLGLGLHLLPRQLAGGPTVEEGGHLDALSNPFSILTLFLLDAFLNVLWIVALKHVGLALKAIIEFR